MSKVKIIFKNSLQNILFEKELLSKLRHKFMCNLIYSFQDNDNLYYILELLKGGDLRYHILRNKKKINETQLKFLIQNIILVLEYIHSNNIIHRDIKPENIIFDDDGYIHLNDFSLSRLISDNTSGDISGSLGYISPETLFRSKQKFTSDFYSIGIICYEIIMGKRPYFSNKYNLMKNEILYKKAFIDCNNINNENKFSDDCINFINGLLIRNPNKRLGSKFGIKELKDFSWFDDNLWDKIYNKEIISPFITLINEARTNLNTKEIFDEEYCNRLDLLVKDYVQEKYDEIKLSKEYKYAFKNFNFLYLENNRSNVYFPAIDNSINESFYKKKNKINLKSVLLRKNKSLNNSSYFNSIYSNNSKKNKKLVKKKSNIEKNNNKKSRLSVSLNEKKKLIIRNKIKDEDSVLFISNDSDNYNNNENINSKNENPIQYEIDYNNNKEKETVSTKVEECLKFNNIVLEELIRIKKLKKEEKKKKLLLIKNHFFKNKSWDKLDFKKPIEKQKYIFKEPNISEKSEDKNSLNEKKNKNKKKVRFPFI